MTIKIVEENYLVTTPDGKSLAVKIKRPEHGQPRPCLMTYTPYRVSSGLGGVDLLEYAKHDYVTMIFDVRGTGDSSGICDSVYSDDERADGLFMIDWASKQPWCDGQVGMWGISYGAIIALQMAAETPPALKAIIARSGSDDPFAEWTNLGGAPRNYMYESYSPFMSARNFAPPSFEHWGEKWLEIWQERLTGNVPWGISFLENIEDSQFWRNRAARPKLQNIKCPVFVVEGWSDWYSNPMLRIFGKLKSPKRALIGPWGHQWPDSALPGPRINWEKEALLWWDYWLKGAANGLEQTPALNIFVQDPVTPSNFTAVAAGEFFTSSSWPIPEMTPDIYYLDLDQTKLSTDLNLPTGSLELSYKPLAGKYSGKVGGGPFRFNVLRPLDQRLEDNNGITFFGQEAAEDYLIIGNPSVELKVSSNSKIGQLAATLVDVFPDGTQTQITRHFINLAYASYSTKPAAALNPGEIYAVEIELPATAYRIKAGHKLGLKLSTSDIQMSWPPANSFVVTIHNHESMPAKLMVPIVSAGVDQKPSSLEVLTGDQGPELPEVSYEFFENQVTNEVGYRFESKSVFGNSGELKFDQINPATAKITAQSEFQTIVDSKQIKITATCETTSDPINISHQVKITATIDGNTHWENNWQATKERRVF